MPLHIEVNGSYVFAAISCRVSVDTALSAPFPILKGGSDLNAAFF